MQKRQPQTVDQEQIPEVVEFINASDALKEFKEEHPAVFETLKGLVDAYNATLEQAAKACHQNEVSCGPFVLNHFSTKYDGEALFNAVGRDVFLQLGGQIKQVSEYEVDRGKLEAAIAQNRVSGEVVKAVRKETPNFSKPKPVIIP